MGKTPVSSRTGTGSGRAGPQRSSASAKGAVAKETAAAKAPAPPKDPFPVPIFLPPDTVVLNRSWKKTWCLCLPSSAKKSISVFSLSHMAQCGAMVWDAGLARGLEAVAREMRDKSLERVKYLSRVDFEGVGLEHFEPLPRRLIGHRLGFVESIKAVNLEAFIVAEEERFYQGLPTHLAALLHERQLERTPLRALPSSAVGAPADLVVPEPVWPGPGWTPSIVYVIEATRNAYAREGREFDLLQQGVIPFSSFFKGAVIHCTKADYERTGYPFVPSKRKGRPTTMIARRVIQYFLWRDAQEAAGEATAEISLPAKPMSRYLNAVNLTTEPKGSAPSVPVPVDRVGLKTPPGSDRGTPPTVVQIGTGLAPGDAGTAAQFNGLINTGPRRLAAAMSDRSEETGPVTFPFPLPGKVAKGVRGPAIPHRDRPDRKAFLDALWEEVVVLMRNHKKWWEREQVGDPFFLDRTEEDVAERTYSDSEIESASADESDDEEDVSPSDTVPKPKGPPQGDLNSAEAVGGKVTSPEAAGEESEKLDVDKSVEVDKTSPTSLDDAPETEAPSKTDEGSCPVGNGKETLPESFSEEPGKSSEVEKTGVDETSSSPSDKESEEAGSDPPPPVNETETAAVTENVTASPVADSESASPADSTGAPAPPRESVVTAVAPTAKEVSEGQGPENAEVPPSTEDQVEGPSTTAAAPAAAAKVQTIALTRAQRKRAGLDSEEGREVRPRHK